MLIKSAFPSSEGTKDIVYYIYEPSDVKNARGVIQIAHGMCEYIDRYGEFIVNMNRRGYIVAGNDHLGHGRTALNDEERGFFAEKNGWRFLTRDLHRMTLILREKYTGLPLVLVGHSMGSFISRLCLSWFPEDIDAAVLMGTCAGVPKTAAAVAADLMGAVKGKRTHVNVTRGIAYNALALGIPGRKSSDDWITRDRQKLESYENDELGNFSFTAQAYSDLVRLLNEVSADDWAASVPPDKPILLISGDRDPLGENGKGVRKVYERLREAGARKITLRLYKDARHELMNETNREEVYSDIGRWTEMALKSLKKPE